MSITTLNRSTVKALPAPPDGAAKVRYFDDRLSGFIAEGGTAALPFT